MSGSQACRSQRRLVYGKLKMAASVLWSYRTRSPKGQETRGGEVYDLDRATVSQMCAYVQTHQTLHMCRLCISC